MAGLVPAIHVFRRCKPVKAWMPGIKPGMTDEVSGKVQAAHDEWISPDRVSFVVFRQLFF